MQALETQQVLRRRLTVERLLFRRPDVNVLMVVKVRGNIDAPSLSEVLLKIRKRHPLLFCRVEVDAQGVAWFTGEDVPEIDIEDLGHTKNASDEVIICQSFRHHFPFSRGPLIRFTLYRSPSPNLLAKILSENTFSTVIINCQHMIGDGRSLLYLVHDIFRYWDTPADQVPPLAPPPLLTRANLPFKLRENPVVRWYLGKLNREWQDKGTSFSDQDYAELYERFWTQESQIQMKLWSLPPDSLASLSKNCHREGVTIHTALATAFLAAQEEFQGHRQAHHNTFRMPVEVRRLVEPPAPESLGLFASSLDLHVRYHPRKDFWKNARTIASKIRQKNTLHNLARFLAFERVDPGIMDALYFQRYGFIDDPLVRLLSRRLRFDRLAIGLLITNLGRFPHSPQYRSHTLEAIYGPCVYGPTAEKLLGVCTVGHRMCFAMGYNAQVVSPGIIEKICARATAMLEQKKELR